MAVMARWCGVLCVGDYLSNVEIPMVEAGLGDYRATLARLAPLVEAAETVVPGHGSPHTRAEALRILDEDVDYLDALERGEDRLKLPAGRDSGEQRKIHTENLKRLRAG
jgi:glyoxylase-like metal-dependent hydrolase (beta-lactamase superfamily II)